MIFLIGALEIVLFCVCLEIVFAGNPTVYLNSTSNSTTSTTGSVNFNCNMSDTEQNQNISLYTNTTGSWLLNQTISIGQRVANVSEIVALLHLNGDVTDSSGYGNNGVVQGSLSYATGQFYNGIRFLGNTANFVNISDKPYFSPANNNFTVMMWYNPNVTGEQYIASKACAGGYEWAVEQQADNTIKFWMWSTAGTTKCGAVSSKVVTAGKWYLIGGEFNGTICKAILNDTVTVATTYLGGLGDGSCPVVIGKRNDDSGNKCNCTIDEFVMYNRSLSDAEVGSAFNYGKTFYDANFTLSNLPNLGNYVWNCLGYDNDSNSDWGDVNYTFYTNLSTVTLGTNPADNSNSSTSTITFDVKCNNAAVNTLQLWSNWTGVWSENQTNTTPKNGVYWNVTISNIPNVTFIWGAKCNDTSNNIVWNNANRTVSVDTYPFTIMLVSPANTSTYTDTNASFTCNATYKKPISNVSLYTNTTGSWILNQTYVSNSTMTLDSSYDVADVYAQNDTGDTHYYSIQMKWDISNIPKNSSISNAMLCMYIYNNAFDGINNNSNFSRLSNQTWSESISADSYNMQNGSETNNTNSYQWNRTNVGTSCINIANALLTDYNSNNNFTSFRIQDLDYPMQLASAVYNTTGLSFGKNVGGEVSSDNEIEFASREYTADTTKRPYIIITYVLGNTTTVKFDLKNITGGNYTWNCLAYNSYGTYSWGNVNWTFSTPNPTTTNNCTPPASGFWVCKDNCVFTNQQVVYTAGRFFASTGCNITLSRSNLTVSNFTVNSTLPVWFSVVAMYSRWTIMP
jgi:hypothetical protein